VIAMGREKITALPATPRLVARIVSSSALNMVGNMLRRVTVLKSVLFQRV
jgi:hypothetical protein